MVDDSDPVVESDLRRRAAWLLLMLAIVAVLLVVVISALVKTNSSSGDGGNGSGPLDNIATSPGSSSPSGHHPSTHHGHRPGTSGQSDTTTSVPVGQTSCPTSERCILQGDVGNSTQAINTFRAQHGLTAVPTSVGPQAQSCAFHDGSGCSGSWALTYLSTPDAQEAVQKIDQYAHFEDPNIKSVQVGWAFDPGSKLYYFAVIRNG